MASFGRTVLREAGRPINVSADGQPEWKLGGVTVDWDNVTAAGSDTTLSDGTEILSGDKYLPFGTILYYNSGNGKYRVAGSGTTLNIGETFIVNSTVVSTDGSPNDHIGVIEGGRVWEDRLDAGGSGEPTLANVYAAMPRIAPVKQ